MSGYSPRMRVLCFYVDDYTEADAADEVARVYGPEAEAIPVRLTAWRERSDRVDQPDHHSAIQRTVARLRDVE